MQGSSPSEFELPQCNVVLRVAVTHGRPSDLRLTFMQRSFWRRSSQLRLLLSRNVFGRPPCKLLSKGLRFESIYAVAGNLRPEVDDASCAPPEDGGFGIFLQARLLVYGLSPCTRSPGINVHPRGILQIISSFCFDCSETILACRGLSMLADGEMLSVTGVAWIARVRPHTWDTTSPARYNTRCCVSVKPPNLPHTTVTPVSPQLPLFGVHHMSHTPRLMQLSGMVPPRDLRAIPCHSECTSPSTCCQAS
jgi:hypothetical protein